MKKIHIITLLMVCLYSIPVLAGSPVVKEKKFTNRFTADNNSRLSITNKYGKVHINTWNKNEVSVEVVVTAKEGNEDKAERLLNTVSIKQSKTGNSYSYVTEMKNKRVIINKDHELRIDYTINMPPHLALELNNKFGDVYLADYAGAVRMGVEYGAIKTQKLTNDKVDIEVGFGSVNITSLEKAYIISQYSKVTIDNAGTLTLNNRFGKTYVGNVKSLHLTQDYGEVSLNKVNILKGIISFADITINKMGKNVDLTMKYCSKTNLGIIDGSIEHLIVRAKFSKIYCTVDNTTNMDVVIATKFGNVKYRSAQGLLLEKMESADRYSNTYKGKIGDGKGKLFMSLEYTDVIFK